MRTQIFDPTPAPPPTLEVGWAIDYELTYQWWKAIDGLFPMDFTEEDDFSLLDDLFNDALGG